MKFLLLAALICICGFTGLLFAYSFRKRVKELTEILFGLELLSTEMVYAKNPLWLCFLQAAKGMNGEIAAFFSAVGQGLKDQRFTTAEKGFLSLLKEGRESLSLQPSDLEVLMRFATGLGATDREHEEEKFKTAHIALEKALINAKEQEGKWGRVAGSSGWLFGIFLSLLWL